MLLVKEVSEEVYRLNVMMASLAGPQKAKRLMMMKGTLTTHLFVSVFSKKSENVRTNDVRLLNCLPVISSQYKN